MHHLIGLFEPYGEIAKAVVIDKRKVGGKGIERIIYSFSFNGQRYEGWVDDDFYEVGDTIQILFLKENPSINGDKSSLIELLNDVM